MASSSLPQIASPTEFASELIKARAESGLTQSQLAQESGVSLSAIKSYESGRNMPGSRELRELCQALKTSPNKLLFGVDFPFKLHSAARLFVGEQTDPEGPSESVQVKRNRTLLLLEMLAADERDAVLTLVQALSLARHGEAKVKEKLIAADLLTGITNEMVSIQREAKANNGDFRAEDSAGRLEAFMERQGHTTEPEKLPKK